MICPVCHSAKVRRSKRRSVVDYLFSVVSIVPWRCEECEARFHASPMPFRHLFYAHCAVCGNLDLRPISAEHVPGIISLVGRLLRLPALRCEPCRHKFFSIRPLMRNVSDVASTSTN
jgi:C4-type Zn-finger protein